MNKKFFIAGKICISVILIGLLIRHVEWNVVWQHLMHVSPVFIVLFLSIYVIGILISSYKWQIIARGYLFDHNLVFYFKQYIIGAFLNNFFPSFLGGDAYRAYAASRANGEVAKSSQIIIIDRFTGLFGVLFLSVVCGFVLLALTSVSVNIVMIIYGVATLFIALTLGVIFFDSRFVQFFMQRLPQKIGAYIQVVFDFRKKKELRPTLLWSIVFAFVGLATSNYILFLAVGVTVPPLQYLSIIFLISIISSVPISIGNIGVKEWAYVTLFGLFGVSAAVCVTVVLLSRVLQMLVSFAAFPLYATEKKHLTKKK